MGGIIGGITDAIGLTDYAGQEAAQKSASKAADYSYNLAKENIAFQKEQYNDWKAVYGDLQENIGKYYKELTPEKITTLGLQNQQKEYQAALKTIETTAAQRGITNSGLEFAAKSSATMQNATARATIRTTAEDAVKAQQLEFLKVGLGQGTQYAANVGSAYNTGVQSANNILSNYTQSYNNLFKTNSDQTGSIIGSFLGSN